MNLFAAKILEFDKVKGLLADKAATHLGREAAENIRVEHDCQKVQALQQETEEVIRIFDEGQRLPFGGCYDITALLKRTEIGSILEPEELLQVGSTLSSINAMKNFLAVERGTAPTLAGIGDELVFFTKLEKQINSIVDEHGVMRDNASPKLGSLRSAIADAKNKVRQHLDGILHNSSYQKYFQENLVTMRGDRYVIPVKQEYRMNFPGIVHDQSSTGVTLFIEPLAVVNLNNDIKRFLAEERQEIERILRQITANIGAEAGEVWRCLKIMVRLDVISAKGLLALEQHGVRPQLSTDYRVRIHQGRHPLLDPKSVVPLDLAIGDGYTMLLITGPNTGGKTVALKTLGLFALMAQAGLYLPALNVEIPVFTAVYGDIGDEQSIEQSLSTFSGHMKTVIEILDSANKGDLILIDELCAGTDPNEGAALAMSILDNLNSRGIMTMVTTHYSELKTFAYNHPGMLNASVEFNQETLLPTYKLLLGVPGSSNAFNISRRLGLPGELVDKAGAMLQEEHRHMEKVLNDLEEKRRNFEISRDEIEEMRFETEKLRNQLSYQKREFMKERNILLRKAREQADEIYRSSRREAEIILKELRTHKKDFDEKELQRLTEMARTSLYKDFSVDQELPEGQPLTMEKAQPGQNVFVKSLGKNGRILKKNAHDVTIQMGILRMNLAAEDCILTVAQPADIMSQESKPRRVKNSREKLIFGKVQNSKLDVDLRGMMVEEALPVIDKAIDDAMLSGIGRLRIVHGKGTGALKAGVVPYLKGHPMVKSVQEAANEEGGAGVTIIELI